MFTMYKNIFFTFKYATQIFFVAILKWKPLDFTLSFGAWKNLKFFHFESLHMVDSPNQITYECEIIFKINPPPKPQFMIPFLLIYTKFQRGVSTWHSYQQSKSSKLCQNCLSVHMRQCAQNEQNQLSRTMWQAALNNM